MNEIVSSELLFLGYKLTDITYKCPPDLEKDSEGYSYFMRFCKKAAQVSDNRICESLRVDIHYSTNPEGNDAKMTISAEIVGLFESTEQWISKWERNALSILFPYLRSVVSTITSLSGHEPIILPTININSLFDIGGDGLVSVP